MTPTPLPRSLIGLHLTGMAAVAVLGLGIAPFWYDESISVLFAAQPLDRMVAATLGDVHPPLYYGLLWMVGRVFGYSEFAMRLPSLLFTLGTMAMIVMIAQQLNRPRAGWLAVGLLAILPFQHHYAAEARMYALLQLLVAGAVWAVFARRWLLVAVLYAAMIYTHNYGWLYAASIGALSMFTDDPEGTPGLMPSVAGSIGIVLSIPAALTMALQMGALDSAGYWVQQLSVGGLAYWLYNQWWAWADTGGLAVALGLLTFLALGAALWVALKERTNAHWACLWLAVSVPAMAAVASVVWQPIWLPRALIGTAPFWGLLVGMALDRIYNTPRWWLAVAAAPLLGFALLYYYGSIAEIKGDQTPTASAIIEHYQPGDVVVHVSENSLVATLPYMPTEILRATRLMEPVAYNAAGLSMATRQALGFQHVESPADALGRDFSRALVVWVLSPINHAELLPIRGLLADCTQLEYSEMDLVIVGIYDCH